MGKYDMNSNICSTINTSIADSVNRQDEVLNGSGPNDLGLESKIGQHGINVQKSVPQFATEQKKDEFVDAAIKKARRQKRKSRIDTGFFVTLNFVLVCALRQTKIKLTQVSYAKQQYLQ